MVYQFIKNVKHNGITYVAGTIVEKDDGTLEPLIREGYARVIPQAASVSEGRRMVSLEEREKEAEKERLAAQAPKNTWGPQPDPKPEEEANDANDDKPKEQPKAAEDIPADNNNAPTGDDL